MALYKRLKAQGARGLLDRHPRVKGVMKRALIERNHLRQTHRSQPFGKRKYYIIRYDNEFSPGWAVWQQVVLYQSIYAERHGMIPVVDMKNYPNMYQEDGDLGSVNTWDTYFEQPGGVSLEEAYASGDYVISDGTMDWFSYVRIDVHGVLTPEYVWSRCHRYVRLNDETGRLLEKGYRSLFPDDEEHRLVGMVIRGTDYKTFHHPRQPSPAEVAESARFAFVAYDCDYYYVATEDRGIFREVCGLLPSQKLLSYKAGTVEDDGGLVGEKIRSRESARRASLDYLQILYNLSRCVALIGGRSGATDISRFACERPYEFLNIFQYEERY